MHALEDNCSGNFRAFQVSGDTSAQALLRVACGPTTRVKRKQGLARDGGACTGGYGAHGSNSTSTLQKKML